MSPSVPSLGNWFREQRIELGLTQAELAGMVAVSTETLSAIERNKRPISESVLIALLDAFGLETSQVRMFAEAYANTQVSPSEDPFPHEISALAAITAPACYQEVRTYRVVAANAAARHRLPGLVPGACVIEWVLLDPNARAVIADWYGFAHAFVYFLRHMAGGMIEPRTHASIVRSCSRAPEWERMWNTRPDSISMLPTVTLIDPVTGVASPVHLTSFTVQ
ncbi:helix-turn-helix domain-containing protein, partial [Nocardia gipuzkoensis]